ncbi:methyltransferase domain-containing protein [Candidatus Dojkabacteria bacterium]|nr:methyltransferase domain-containing protein [Candidatus Dojkabacteria bacterium]
MDKKTRKNERLWDQLSRKGVLCSRPNSKTDPEEIRESLDPYNLFGDINGKSVLCLASGGGQQSIQFALLGAEVAVVDFSEEQLKQDEKEAYNLGLDIHIVQADMRDLSAFKDTSFDIVYQPYSINYIPQIKKLFDEIDRVMKAGGIYYLMFHNPFVHGSWKDGSWGSKWDKDDLWRGKGYPVYTPYKDGYPVKVDDPTWNFENKDGEVVKIEAPQEYKHTLSTIINSLIQRGFTIKKFDEVRIEDGEKEEIGSWDHYVSVAAPWFHLWSQKN